MTDQINVALLCSGISKTFGNHRALIDVDLSVRKGEVLTILGPSGCGKTTLLRIIAGLELADAGQVFLNDEDITRYPASRRPINTVFQSYALFPHLDVFSNVAFGLQAKKTAKSKITQKVGDILSLVRMDGLEKRFPHQLSGGQKQRVALARALVNEPKLLLLDEPMSALDAHLRTKVQDELRALQKELGTTFVLVTHDQNEAKRLSNHLAVMNEGQIIQFGTTEKVFTKPDNKFVAEFLGATNLFEASRDGALYRTRYGPMDVTDKPVWDEGKILIWPERIEIHEKAKTGEPNWFSCYVRDRVFNGDGLDLLLVKDAGNDSLEKPILVKARNSFDIQSGQEVGVYFPPDYLVPLENRAQN
ncbi:MAG: ABC transporter ATP-binding protein [Deltaproteobacteria bacterium]|nr:ABC transporter ATP-binding protein [Deltaproteobacteria bacterium]